MSWSKKIVYVLFGDTPPNRDAVTVFSVRSRQSTLARLENVRKANCALRSKTAANKGDVRPSSLGLARFRAHLSRARPAVGGGPRRATRVGGVVLSGCPASCLGVFWRLPGIAVQSPS